MATKKFRTVIAFVFFAAGLYAGGNHLLAQSPGHDFHAVHGYTSSFPKINYDSLFQQATNFEDSEDGRKLLDQCLEAYGGEDHLRALQSYQTFWTMEGLTEGVKEPVIRSFARDGRYRIDRLRQDWTETRALNKSEAWFQNPDTAYNIVTGRYKAEVYSYLILAMPLGIVDEAFDDVRYAGGMPGDTLQYIFLHRKDTFLIALGIDPEDHFVKTCAGVIKEAGASLTFLNLFSEFKKVNDYVFPHRLINVAMGLKVGDSELDSVRVNPEMTADMFEFPGTI